MQLHEATTTATTTRQSILDEKATRGKIARREKAVLRWWLVGLLGELVVMVAWLVGWLVVQTWVQLGVRYTGTEREREE